MRVLKAIILSLFPLLFSSCISYNVLPENVSEKSNIVGFYLNDSNDKYNTRIWQVLDYKHEIKEYGITTRVEILNEKTLSFTFLKDNDVIGKKLVKGKFKDDNCFYKRRVFYVIPIFPIICGFVNNQTRIYFANNELVIENAYNHGGIFFVIASGDKGNRVYRFKRI